jgi:hypothetical protein
VTRRGSIAGLGAAVVAAALVAVPVAGAVRLTRVNVSIVENTFTLSRWKVPRGPAVFVVVNRGHRPHSFVLSNYGQTPLLQPGRRFVLRVRLRTRGDVVYFSSVPQEDEMGLYRILVVR